MNATLFNGCFEQKEPDWTRFGAVEVSPVAELEGGNCQICEPSEATFWSIYGRLVDGRFECLTDVSTEKLANEIAGTFRRKLSLETESGR